MDIPRWEYSHTVSDVRQQALLRPPSFESISLEIQPYTRPTGIDYALPLNEVEQLVDAHRCEKCALESKELEDALREFYIRRLDYFADILDRGADQTNPSE